MIELPPTFRARLARIVGVSLVVLVLLMFTAGTLTLFLVGQDSLVVIATACLIAGLSSVIGSIPMCKAFSGDGPPEPKGVLGSMLLRVVCFVVLAVPVALSGWLDARLLFIWLALAYLSLLGVDTFLMSAWMKSINRNLNS